MFNDIIIVALLCTTIATAITYICTPFVRRMAIRYNLVDDPTKRYHPATTHTGIVPRAGGLAMFIGILVTTFPLFFLWPTWGVLMTACGTIVVIGLIDDKRDVHPYIRASINAILVLCLIAAGIRIDYISHPFVSGNVLSFTEYTFTVSTITVPYISVIVTFIWMYWTMNIVGWSAGVAGQLPGISAIAATTMAIVSLRYSIGNTSSAFVTWFAAAVAGVSIGFLPWNFFPQRIMPGYGGKTLLGMLLAVTSVLSYAKLGTAALVLALPMADAVFTLTRRIIAGRSPIWADNHHLHHELLRLGLSTKQVSLLYYIVSAILGAVALAAGSIQKVAIFIGVISISFIFLVWIRTLWQSSKPLGQDNG